jgi:ADP-ribose pyrophosphatase YjhB (NUDIX family)
MDKQIDSSIVFIYNKNKTKVLMIKRVKKFGFDWGFICKKFEASETAKECANKEVFEELGLQDLNLTPFKKVKHQKYGETYFHHYFQTQIDENTKMNYSKTEIQTLEWFKLTNLPMSRALDDPREALARK